MGCQWIDPDEPMEKLYEKYGPCGPNPCHYIKVFDKDNNVVSSALEGKNGYHILNYVTIGKAHLQKFKDDNKTFVLTNNDHVEFVGLATKITLEPWERPLLTDKEIQEQSKYTFGEDHPGLVFNDRHV
jgi:hypothetical protein